MTENQWKLWERRNKAALIFCYGPEGVDKRLDRLRKKVKRNEARIKSCKLHNFDWRSDIEAARKRREKHGVEILLPPGVKPEISCRCKNCGGKLPLMYAAPYMEAIEHMAKNQGAAIKAPDFHPKQRKIMAPIPDEGNRPYVCPSCHNTDHPPGARFCYVCGLGFPLSRQPKSEN